jgi:hypothetical protein
MPGTEILSIKKVPSEGATGLSMIAPVLGLPLFFHALSGVFVAGLGAVAISTVMSPFTGKILQATKGTTLLPSSGFRRACLEPSLPEPLSITFSVEESVSETC